jgi:regulator of sigma E protease
VEVSGRSGLDAFDALKEVGWIGLGHSRFLTYLSVGDGSLAQRAGLRSGDRVLAVNDREFETWEEWRAAYAEAPRGSTLTLRVARGAGDEEAPIGVDVQSVGSLEALGVAPAVVRVGQVSPDSAAAEGGVASGDLLLAVDGAPLLSFAAFREQVLRCEGKSLEITYARDGEVHRTSITPRMTETEVIDGIVEKIYLIGIAGQDEALAGAFAKEVIRNPLRSIPRATEMTFDITRSFLVGLGKLVSGEIPRNQVGGPLRIAEEAHRAFQSGWDRYMRLMILISINLGILNLLPIPVLDGGQAVIFTAEGILRSPLSPRLKEALQGAGLVLLALLMGFAFWNDLARYGGMLMEIFRGSGAS